MDQWRRPTDKLRDEIERLKAELGQVREILGDREAEIERLKDSVEYWRARDMEGQKIEAELRAENARLLAWGLALGQLVEKSEAEIVRLRPRPRQLPRCEKCGGEAEDVTDNGYGLEYARCKQCGQLLGVTRDKP